MIIYKCNIICDLNYLKGVGYILMRYKLLFCSGCYKYMAILCLLNIACQIFSLFYDVYTYLYIKKIFRTYIYSARTNLSTL